MVFTKKRIREHINSITSISNAIREDLNKARVSERAVYDLENERFNLMLSAEFLVDEAVIEIEELFSELKS